jgi:SAM-dependent methyltransferase
MTDKLSDSDVITQGSPKLEDSARIRGRQGEQKDVGLLMENLADFEYLRQRLEPRPGDEFYLCLSDLLIAIRNLIPSGAARILDYGSGGSPYRSLFGNCVYHRADLTGESLDFTYGPDARLDPSVGRYDLVLSTQVLEHVESPTTYLRECHRVLNPGGQLLLSTHGLFEDHGCPDDFWRWTAFGLRQMVEGAGFQVEVSKKVTTGPRAAIFLAERQFHELKSHPIGAYGNLLALGIRVIQKLGPRMLHIASDKTFRDNRVVDASLVGHDMYICIALRAVRK